MWPRAGSDISIEFGKTIMNAKMAVRLVAGNSWVRVRISIYPILTQLDIVPSSVHGLIACTWRVTPSLALLGGIRCNNNNTVCSGWLSLLHYTREHVWTTSTLHRKRITEYMILWCVHAALPPFRWHRAHPHTCAVVRRDRGWSVWWEGGVLHEADPRSMRPGHTVAKARRGNPSASPTASLCDSRRLRWMSERGGIRTNCFERTARSYRQ